MSNTFTEVNRDGAALVSESNGTRSRKQITIPQGVKFAANAVLFINDAGIPEEYSGAPDKDANAVLFDAVDTTAATGTNAATEAVVFVRDAEFNGAELAWKTGLAVAKVTSGIASLGIAGLVVLDGSPT